MTSQSQFGFTTTKTPEEVEKKLASLTFADVEYHAERLVTELVGRPRYCSTLMKIVTGTDDQGRIVDTGVPFRFRLIPEEESGFMRKNSVLHDYIEVSGGVVTTKEDDPYAVTILNDLYYVLREDKDVVLPPDCYSSSLIYEVIKRDMFDLPFPNARDHLLTPSKYESYDLLQILKREVRWTDLKLKEEVIPVEPVKAQEVAQMPYNLLSATKESILTWHKDLNVSTDSTRSSSPSLLRSSVIDNVPPSSKSAEVPVPTELLEELEVAASKSSPSETGTRKGQQDCNRNAAAVLESKKQNRKTGAMEEVVVIEIDPVSFMETPSPKGIRSRRREQEHNTPQTPMVLAHKSDNAERGKQKVAEVESPAICTTPVRRMLLRRKVLKVTPSAISTPSPARSQRSKSNVKMTDGHADEDENVVPTSPAHSIPDHSLENQVGDLQSSKLTPTKGACPPSKQIVNAENAAESVARGIKALELEPESVKMTPKGKPCPLSKKKNFEKADQLMTTPAKAMASENVPLPKLPIHLFPPILSDSASSTDDEVKKNEGKGKTNEDDDGREENDSPGTSSSHPNEEIGKKPSLVGWTVGVGVEDGSGSDSEIEDVQFDDGEDGETESEEDAKDPTFRPRNYNQKTRKLVSPEVKRLLVRKIIEADAFRYTGGKKLYDYMAESKDFKGKVASKTLHEHFRTCFKRKLKNSENHPAIMRKYQLTKKEIQKFLDGFKLAKEHKHGNKCPPDLPF